MHYIHQAASFWSPNCLRYREGIGFTDCWLFLLEVEIYCLSCIQIHRVYGCFAEGFYGWRFWERWWWRKVCRLHIYFWISMIFDSKLIHFGTFLLAIFSSMGSKLCLVFITILLMSMYLFGFLPFFRWRKICWGLGAERVTSWIVSDEHDALHLIFLCKIMGF